VSLEILPIAMQQCRNYLYDKSRTNRSYEVGGLQWDSVYRIPILKRTRRYVASLRADLTLMIYWPVVVGNVGDNSVSSYRPHASETEQLSFSIQTAGLAFGGTGLCSYCVRVVGAVVQSI